MATINYSEFYSPKVQERLKMKSQSELFCNHNYNWDGHDTIHIYTLQTAPLNDYNYAGQGNRYGVPVDIKDSIQSEKIKYDKSFSFVIENGDAASQAIQKSASKQLLAQVDYKIKPFIEKERFEAMAKLPGGVYIPATDLTAANVFETFLKGRAAVTNAKGSASGRLCAMTPEMVNLLLLGSNQTGGMILHASKSEEEIEKGVIGTLGGIKIVEVAAEYLPENVVMLFGHPDALCSAEQLKNYKINDNPQGYDGTLCEGHLIGGSFVLESQCGYIFAVYSTGTLAELPTLAYEEGTGVTITCADDVYYTIDGSDPRISTTKIQGKTIDTSNWTAANGETLIRAYGSGTGKINSVVAEITIPVALAPVRE